MIGNGEKLMHRQRRLATLFVVLALTECAQATAGQPGAPYAPYSLENMHDRGGDDDGGGSGM